MRGRLALSLSALVGAALLASCPALGAERARRGLLILDYNVKSLFDDVDSGTEYPEFSVSRGRWDGPRYRRRLEKLAEVILAASPEMKGPDIVCLEEIENASVLEALRRGPLAESRYRSAAIAVAPGQAIASAVLSRRPILELKCHSTALGKAEGRYILELAFDVGGRTLRGFVCHWKSKLEGAEATEAERLEASRLLAGRIAALLAAEPGAELFACGDFNENPDEYRRVGRRYLTALLPALDFEALKQGPLLLVADSPDDAGLLEAGGIPCPALYSPWASSGGYSYLHEGAEERIDGFLLSPGLLDGEGLSLDSFAALDSDFLLDAEGRPRAWSNADPGGYSDHLPLLLSLGLEDGKAGR